jgi:diguanylate cyclase (GGDEF)-like protein
VSGPFQGVDLKFQLEYFRYVGAGQWDVLIVANGRVCGSSQPEHAVEFFEEANQLGLVQLTEQATSCEHGTRTLWAVPVKDHLKKTIACVVVRGFTNTFGEHALHALQLLVDNLAREMRLNLELADMADELNRRHEELNLIYSTNEASDTGGDDEADLQNIVDHVLEHMEADLVLLSVPSRKLWTLSVSVSGQPFSQSGALKQSETHVLDWLRRNGVPLVINSRAEAEAEGLAGMVPLRTLVVPVYDDKDEIIGGLALCRRKDRPRLVNSDKNLLLTLSTRISKLIQGSFDSLTGLPRRSSFELRLGRAIVDLESSRGQHALIHLNVDGLGAINEQFGVLAGDGALQVVGEQLLALGRQRDISSRLGGDEFAVLLIDCDEAMAVRKAKLLQDSLARKPFMAGKARHILRISAGVVEVHSGMTAVEAMTKASVVCGIAKESGGNCVEAFGKALGKVSAKREEMRVLTEVRRALEEDRFVLYAQEIRALSHQDDAPHFEVLIRLFDDDGKMVPPIEFIPIAEKHNIMPAIDRWVIRRTLKQLRESGVLDQYPGTVCSINLSGQSLATGSVLEDLDRLIREQLVPPENLCFEVTETAAIADLAAAQLHINRVRRLGCRFALDDFGAGLSSFSYLRSLPLDYVKIDGSFVRDICRDETARVMVAAIHSVGKSMGLLTVAEYVEDQAIIDVLRAIGVDYAQGYGIGKPMPMNDFLAAYAGRLQRQHG